MKTICNRIAILMVIAVLTTQCKKDKEKETPLPGTKNEWVVLSKEEQALDEGSWAFTHENKAYLFCEKIFVYDVLQKKWTGETISLPDDFKCHLGSMVTRHNNKIYIAGGEDLDGNKRDDFWEFDPAKSEWKRLADLPDYLLNGSMFVYDNILYIGFADDYGGGYYNQTKIHSYSFATNAWSDNIIELNINGGTNGIFFQMGEHIFFGGGHGNRTPSKPTTFYQYNLKTKALKELAELPNSIIHPSQAFCFVLNKKGYAITDTDLVIYDFEANTWQKLDNIPKDDKGEGPNHSILINNRIISFTKNGVAFEYL